MSKKYEGLESLNDKTMGRPVSCSKFTLTPRKGKDYAEVIFIGDVHLGSPECDEEKFVSMLRHCERNDVYVFFMGDMIEASTRHSVGAGVYEQARTRYGTIQDQYEAIVEYLRPISEQGKVLGFLTGNHCDRVYNLTGVNIGKAMCRELDIRYLGSACWSYWRVGSQGYRIYAIHGSSGSRFVHTKIKSVVDISHSFDADVIAQGHVHECADVQQLVQYYDAGSKSVRERKKFLLITGHYLRYMGYAKTKGMPPSKLGSPKVKLFADRFDIHISW